LPRYRTTPPLLDILLLLSLCELDGRRAGVEWVVLGGVVAAAPPWNRRR